MRVVVSLRSLVLSLIPCTHRTAQDVRVFVSSHQCMKWAFPLTFLISSSPSSSFSHSSSTSSSSCYPSTSQRLSSKITCATSPRTWGQLTSPSPTQDRVHVYHSQRDGLCVGQSSSCVSERTGRSVGERTGRPDRPSGQELNTEHAQIRTLLERQKEQILAECQAEIKKHEFQADYDRRSARKLGEIIESPQEELYCAQAEELQRRDQQLLHERILHQNSELREAHNKSLSEMEQLKKFQSSTFDTIARRRLVEDQDTILELSGRRQELQNEVNCMSDSKEFQDAESIRSGNSHVTSQPVPFSPHPVPGGMLSRSFGVPSRREGPPSIWDKHGISGNVFANPDASSSAPYPQELNPWSSSTEEPLHPSTVEKSERQTQDQDPRFQSGQSAKNSVIFSGGDSSKNYGADQQRLQISDLHFDKFPTPATLRLLEDKIQDWGMYLFTIFLRKLCFGSKKWRLVDSVDDLKIFVICKR